MWWKRRKFSTRSYCLGLQTNSPKKKLTWMYRGRWGAFWLRLDSVGFKRKLVMGGSFGWWLIYRYIVQTKLYQKQPLPKKNSHPFSEPKKSVVRGKNIMNTHAPTKTSRIKKSCLNQVTHNPLKRSIVSPLSLSCYTSTITLVWLLWE